MGVRRMRQCAFVGDTGDSGLSLDKSGTYSHYVLTAVIVGEDRLRQVEEEVELVRRKHFQAGEMSSGKVAGNDDRRMLILQDLRPIGFHVLSFVVAKDRLARSGGFQYHGPFVKFLGMRIQKQMHLAFPSLSVVANQHGDEAFMREFRDYVRRQLQLTLFEDFSFRFEDSGANPLLQLADFIGGTVARGYEAKRKSPRYNEFLQAIQDKIIAFKVWPGGYDKYLVDVAKEHRISYDPTISDCSIRLAQDFVNAHEDDSDPAIHSQVRFLEHLLFRLGHDSPRAYVPTHALLAHLALGGDRRLSDFQLRTDVVGPLRDRNILIASSPNGYKIPISEHELYEFVNHGMAVIAPMVARLQRCRAQVQLATKNELDILDREEYALLRRLVC